MAHPAGKKVAGFGFPSRAQAGALLVALLALLSITHRVYKLSPQSDAVGAFDLQLKPLLRDLPPHGTVGYVSDATMADDSKAFWEFLYVQYALAPLIVVDSPKYSFVVGNFHGAPWGDKASQLKLTLLKDYGNGVVLLRGAGQ